MVRINVSEAKAHLGDYLRKVSAGETFVLCERNRPVAELRGLPDNNRETPLKLGVLRGKFDVPADFDAPIPEFEKHYYGEQE